MRSRILNRAFAALMLLWFTVVTVDPAALHSCPLHGTLPVASAGGGTDHGEHAVRHAAHDGSLRSDDGDAPAGDHGDRHRCLCLGQCAAGLPLAGLPAASMGELRTFEWTVRAEVLAGQSVHRAAPAFLLPYANGPPAGLRVA